MGPNVIEQDQGWFRRFSRAGNNFRGRDRPGGKGVGKVNDVQPITLVLLPGMHGSGRLFAPFTRELPDFIKPVVVTYPPDRPLDYKEHLNIVMAALPDDEPFVLLGESYSGPLALMAAARNPRGLAGVVLCATFIKPPLSVPVSLLRPFISPLLFRIKTTRLFLRIILGSNAPEWLKKLFFETLVDIRPEVLAARATAVLDLDCSDALRECPVPILAMVAGRDRLVSKRSSELIRAIRPDVEYVKIGAPHLILQCAPAAAAWQVSRFMEAVRDKSGLTQRRNDAT
jgi:pimeloyl-ACP methyl ester carboxylesterase